MGVDIADAAAVKRRARTQVEHLARLGDRRYRQIGRAFKKVGATAERAEGYFACISADADAIN